VSIVLALVALAALEALCRLVKEQEKPEAERYRD
jgi:hypothetical protein